MYFVQTPNEVWMLWERDHFVRRMLRNVDTKIWAANDDIGVFSTSHSVTV
jgi:hypothetical protein